MGEFTNAQWIAIGLIQLLNCSILAIVLMQMKWRIAMDRAEGEDRAARKFKSLDEELARQSERLRFLADKCK